METNIESVIEGYSRISGDDADSIITTLIDNCDDKAAAQSMGCTVVQWSALIQQFEEQIRHRVRNLR